MLVVGVVFSLTATGFLGANGRSMVFLAFAAGAGYLWWRAAQTDEAPQHIVSTVP